MSVLWLVPPVVLIVGTVLALRLVRTTDAVVLDVRRQLLEIGEIHRSVATVRAETARTRAALEQLHRR